MGGLEEVEGGRGGQLTHIHLLEGRGRRLAVSTARGRGDGGGGGGGDNVGVRNIKAENRESKKKKEGRNRMILSGAAKAPFNESY